MQRNKQGRGTCYYDELGDIIRQERQTLDALDLDEPLCVTKCGLPLI